MELLEYVTKGFYWRNVSGIEIKDLWLWIFCKKMSRFSFWELWKIDPKLKFMRILLSFSPYMLQCFYYIVLKRKQFDIQNLLIVSLNDKKVITEYHNHFTCSQLWHSYFQWNLVEEYWYLEEHKWLYDIRELESAGSEGREIHTFCWRDKAIPIKKDVPLNNIRSVGDVVTF